jgi:hypothetical protein
MKQRFLNQKLGKRATRRAELNKAKNLLKKSAPPRPRGTDNPSPCLINGLSGGRSFSSP